MRNIKIFKGAQLLVKLSDEKGCGEIDSCDSAIKIRKLIGLQFHSFRLNTFFYCEYSFVFKKKQSFCVRF